MRALLLVAVLLAAGCEKLPLTDIGAGFALSDAVWFEEEETLFLFYRIEASQGLGPESVVELTYRTDPFELPWTDLSTLEPVHTHLPVDCGRTARCGSMSLHLPDRPGSVDLRLRYHRDGELVLNATTELYLVGPGAPARKRSLIVYGVFDETNERVQWRARHHFPNLRNEEVEDLGLRRTFRISDARYGEADVQDAGNPYAYAFDPACPETMTALPWEALETSERAIFEPDALPFEAWPEPLVCAESTVTDAVGTFRAPAVARKNPEVAAAFPELRSPIRSNTAVGFLLRPCERTISEEHRAMQRQRLRLDASEVLCIDDWQTQGFADQLAADLQAAVDDVRPEGNDMVLTLALHHDDPSGGVAFVVEEALEQVLSFEAGQSSPRVSGAFLFDSYAHSIEIDALSSLALWCPALGGGDDLDDILTTSARNCPLLPDIPELSLGPFTIANVPVLPTRKQYLTFIDKYSADQAGRVTGLKFLAPERTPLSENVRLGEFGLATFFNDESVSALPDESFSFCAADPVAGIVVFRSDDFPDPQPLSMLPDVHDQDPESSYELGLYWEFPFLLRLDYEIVVAGSATAFSATVPFGISRSDRSYWGTDLWRTGEFPLDRTLLRCSRFCDHPTFDSAGVYNVRAEFRDDYRNQCYEPDFPEPGDGGFPRDP